MPTKTSAITFVVSLLGLLVPATALATIHTGHYAYEEPQNGPSLVPLAPRVETSLYLHEVTIAYDDQGGSIVVTAENFDAAHWGTQLERINLQLGPKCEEEGALVQVSLHGIQNYDELGRDSAGATQGTLTLNNYGGQLEAVGAFNGQYFSLTYSNPNLVGLELRCATLGEGETFSLSGYPPLAKSTGLRTYQASRAEIRAMEISASANHSDGFDRHEHHFLSDRKTSNDWAAASWSIFPHNAQPETVVFRFTNGAWRVVTWGSSVCEPGTRIPKSVCSALDI
jgi:hypothetical protein